ncbi:MAG: Heme oxygenase-like protein [Myxococcales bacterium]|nr:Heme oxygenase-like protein [Myxococcales bacterium]
MCDSRMVAFLDDETRAHHVRADADRLALLTPSVLRIDYLAYLAKLYAFEAPIETALLRTPGLDGVIPLKSRTASILLATDLLALGLRLPKLDRVERAMTPYASIGQALGALYVIERGRRLHGTIRRHLIAQLPKEMRAAGSYLSAHEARAFANWRELGTVLDRFASGSGIAQQVLAGAHDTFRGQRTAFVLNQAHAA